MREQRKLTGMRRVCGAIGFLFSCVALCTAGCGGRSRVDRDEVAGAGASTGEGGAPVAVAGQGGSSSDMAGAPTVAGGSSGGTGGAVDDPACSVGHGCAMAMGQNVHELRANATHLFWLTDDTTDPGTPDVRLYRADLPTGHATLVTSHLEQGTYVGVTDSHVLVSAEAKLLRFASSGDTAESIPIHGAVSQGWQGWVAHSGSTAYFATSEGIYRLRADETVPFALTEDYRFGSLAVAGTDLYFEGTPKVHPSFLDVYKVPVSGGPVQLVASGPLHGLQHGGDYMYGFDCGYVGSDCIWRLPLAGGKKESIPSVSTGAGCVMIVGSALYLETASHGQPRGLARQSIDRPGVTDWTIDDALASTGLAGTDGHWVGTAAGLFWTDGSLIYRHSDPR